MRCSPRAGNATIKKKDASSSQAENRSCARGFILIGVGVAGLYESFAYYQPHQVSNLLCDFIIRRWISTSLKGWNAMELLMSQYAREK